MHGDVWGSSDLLADDLKSFKASRRGAAKLVKRVFIDKHKSQEIPKKKSHTQVYVVATYYILSPSTPDKSIAEEIPISCSSLSAFAIQLQEESETPTIDCLVNSTCMYIFCSYTGPQIFMYSWPLLPNCNGNHARNCSFCWTWYVVLLTYKYHLKWVTST